MEHPVESSVFSKAGFFCKRNSLNPFRFSLARETDTHTKNAEQFFLTTKKKAIINNQILNENNNLSILLVNDHM